MANAAVCVETCPTGYIGNGTDCEGTPDLVFDLSYPNTATFAGPWKAKDGAGIDTYDVASESGPDPLLMWERGLWFDGSQHYLTFDSLILNHTWTVAMWIRPKNGSSLLTSESFALSSTPDSQYTVSATDTVFATTPTFTMTDTTAFSGDW
jgi:hypothetical protein